MYDARRRVKPLRLYSHIVFRASDDPEVASCHGIAGASCFWNGNEAPEYVGVAVWEPFEAFVYSEDDQDAGRSGEPWCKVHRISDVRTRVPLMPLFTCDAETYDENRLYDVTDIHGYEAQDLL